jgi:hypothetical protein
MAAATGGSALEYDVLGYHLSSEVRVEKAKLEAISDTESMEYITQQRKLLAMYSEQVGDNPMDIFAKGMVKMFTKHGVGNIFKEVFKDPVYTYHMIMNFNQDELMAQVEADPEYADLHQAIISTGSFPLGHAMSKAGISELFEGIDTNTVYGMEQYKAQVASFMIMLNRYGVVLDDGEIEAIKVGAERTYEQFYPGKYPPPDPTIWQVKDLTLEERTAGALSSARK